MEMLCYLPGQAAPAHKHPSQDEIFIVVEGKATFTIGGEKIPAEALQALLVPAGTEHTIANEGPGNLVALFLKNQPAEAKAEGEHYVPKKRPRRLHR